MKLVYLSMAANATSTAMQLNPVGEGYRETSRSDEKELIDEGELFARQTQHVKSKLNLNSLSTMILNVLLALSSRLNFQVDSNRSSG